MTPAKASARPGREGTEQAAATSLHSAHAGLPSNINDDVFPIARLSAVGSGGSSRWVEMNGAEPGGRYRLTDRIGHENIRVGGTAKLIAGKIQPLHDTITDTVETEVKLLATPAMLDALRAHPALAGRDARAQLVTTYFDTPDARIRAGGASLRIRTQGKRRQQTFKPASADGSAVRRIEYQAPALQDLPDPSLFPEEAAAILTGLLAGVAIEPVATSRVERITRRLRHGESTIEIAFDKGMIEAGDLRQPVSEVELELLDGSLVDILDLVLALPLGPELRWSALSKGQRCHALARGIPPDGASRLPMALTDQLDIARGFQAIAWNCVNRLLAHYPSVLTSADPLAVRECDVALRRLRAALRVFRRNTDDYAGTILRAALKQFSVSLSKVRDLQRLIARVRAAAHVDKDDMSDLLARLERLHDAAVEAVQVEMGGSLFQHFLFQLVGWIEGGTWLAQNRSSGARKPLAPFAARMLSRRSRKVRRGCEALPEKRSSRGRRLRRLRVATKQLRDAVDVFGTGVFDEPVAGDKDVMRSLGRLQRCLDAFDAGNALTSNEALFGDLKYTKGTRLASQLAEILDGLRPSQKRLLRTADRVRNLLRKRRGGGRAADGPDGGGAPRRRLPNRG